MTEQDSTLEAYLATLSPYRRPAMRRRLAEVVELPMGLGVEVQGTTRAAVIEACVASGAEVVEETSRLRHGQSRVAWSMKRTLTIKTPTGRPWPLASLTEAGLAFALHLIGRR